MAYVRERLGAGGVDANGAVSCDDGRGEAPVDGDAHREGDDRPRVRKGDVLELEPDWFPRCDYCLTSPPFMVRGLAGDPLRNYAADTTYEDYLEDVEQAFGRVVDALADDARLVVDVANVRNEGEATTLAWDVADRVRSQFAFEGEVVVTWTGDGPEHTAGSFGYGYDHSDCLVFSAPGE